MKPSFVLLSIALFLLSSSLSDAADFGSPSQSPLMSPTPEPSKTIDCSSVIYSMVDCLSFLTVGSTDPSPTQTCCGGIKTVLEYSPKCLCSALESSRDMGFVLNDNKALALPKICNVPIDPHCDVSTLSASPPISPPVEPPTTSPPSSTKSPAIIRSPPPVRNSSPPVSHSSPARTVSSSTMTASSPAATSPSPSPSISSTGILSVSKLVLAVVLVSSFGFILA
ncbi:PREDICTED: non-specific lipid-transfer protein-like protein At2g13820 [Camelina sativa]|uniref:Non-specific lipid-transfer protein-like protein At2g13820 n=1 Tax=Camelina sativa TaxID=90675 RepID=A0ABM0YFA5_CAMSA|nr:PREDICTED: non-specific lipid-transfer protein-like protein At2g13820 [Camelina sativa]